MTSCLFRPSTADDLPAITAVCADTVVTGSGSFETEPPTPTPGGRKCARWLDIVRMRRALGAGATAAPDA